MSKASFVSSMRSTKLPNREGTHQYNSNCADIKDRRRGRLISLIPSPIMRKKCHPLFRLRIFLHHQSKSCAAFTHQSSHSTEFERLGNLGEIKLKGWGYPLISHSPYLQTCQERQRLGCVIPRPGCLWPWKRVHTTYPSPFLTCLYLTLLPQSTTWTDRQI